MNKYFLHYALPNAIFKIFGQDCSEQIVGLSIDSRTIKKNEIFLALKGENFDGHNFIEPAIENGAIVLIINKSQEKCLNKISPEKLKNKLVLLVDDTFACLKELAKNWRQRFTYPVIGITGSVGKTTTKEMMANILSTAKIHAYSSLKNQNNIIGLSLNILKMNQEHKVAVFEMGISQKGEMEQLADILRPNIALITFIAHAHTDGLGSLAEIVKQKKNIFKFFNNNDIGVVCGDLPLLSNFFHTYPVIKFGLKKANQIQARKVCISYDGEPTTSFVLKIYDKKCDVKLKGNHAGFVNNALAATTLANLLNISPEDIVSGLQTFKTFENRFEKKIIKGNRGTIISDCYNANPESMKAAILAFGQMKSEGLKVAILGDMLELGEKEEFWHKQIGRVLRKAKKLDSVILVGKLAKFIAKTAPAHLKIEFVKDWQQAKEKVEIILQNNSQKQSLFLAKASKAIKLFEMVNQLTK